MAEFSRKGITLSFGLISETVRLTGALDKASEPRLTSLCVGQGTEHPPVAIKSQYTCPECGTIEDRTTLRKGTKVGNGFQIVEAEQVAKIKEDTGAATKHQIALTAHPAEDVRSQTFPTGTLYFLSPEGAGDRYAIIRDLIESHPELAFVAQYTVTSRVATYVASVKDGAILLEARESVGSMKAAPEVSVESNPAMLAMAEQIVEQLVTPFDAAAYADTYTQLLKDTLAAAAVVEGLHTPETKTPAAPAMTDEDLMAKLAEMVAPKPKRRTRKSA